MSDPTHAVVLFFGDPEDAASLLLRLEPAERRGARMVRTDEITLASHAAAAAQLLDYVSLPSHWDPAEQHELRMSFLTRGVGLPAETALWLLSHYQG